MSGDCPSVARFLQDKLVIALDKHKGKPLYYAYETSLYDLFVPHCKATGQLPCDKRPFRDQLGGLIKAEADAAGGGFGFRSHTKHLYHGEVYNVFTGVVVKGTDLASFVGPKPDMAATFTNLVSLANIKRFAQKHAAATPATAAAPKPQSQPQPQPQAALAPVGGPAAAPALASRKRPREEPTPAAAAAAAPAPPEASRRPPQLSAAGTLDIPLHVFLAPEKEDIQANDVWLDPAFEGWRAAVAASMGRRERQAPYLVYATAHEAFEAYRYWHGELAREEFTRAFEALPGFVGDGITHFRHGHVARCLPGHRPRTRSLGDFLQANRAAL